jgi:hypothetical protein
MAGLLEAGDVVLGHGMPVRRGGHNAGIRVMALRVGEPAGVEPGVLDMQVLTALVRLPRAVQLSVSLPTLGIPTPQGGGSIVFATEWRAGQSPCNAGDRSAITSAAGFA